MSLSAEKIRSIAAAAADHHGDRDLFDSLRLIPLESFEAAMRAPGNAASPAAGSTYAPAGDTAEQHSDRNSSEGYEAAFAAAKEYRA